MIMRRERSDLFPVVAITVTWMVTIPLLLYFFIRIVGWPRDFTLLVVLPFVSIWLPLSYPLSVVHNRRYRDGGDLGLSSDMLTRAGLLGVLTSALSVGAVLLYAFYHAKTWWGILLVAVGGAVCLWAAVRVMRGILKGVADRVQTE